MGPASGTVLGSCLREVLSWLHGGVGVPARAFWVWAPLPRVAGRWRSRRLASSPLSVSACHESCVSLCACVAVCCAARPSVHSVCRLREFLV